MEQQKQDIQKLMALFIERDIPIPGNIIDGYNCYIRCDTDIDSDEVMNFHLINPTKGARIIRTQKSKKLYTLFDKPRFLEIFLFIENGNLGV